MQVFNLRVKSIVTSFWELEETLGVRLGEITQSESYHCFPNCSG